MRRLLLALCLALPPLPALADADALFSRSPLWRKAMWSLPPRPRRNWTTLSPATSSNGHGCGAAARLFDDYVAFLDRNPDWPGLPYLRAQGEPSLPRGGDAARVIAYFGGQAPRTGHGRTGAGQCAHDPQGNARPRATS
jgi:soluble lytic murein transglycosylase